MGHKYGCVFILISNYQFGLSFRMVKQNKTKQQQIKKSNFMNNVTHDDKE